MATISIIHMREEILHKRCTWALQALEMAFLRRDFCEHQYSKEERNGPVFCKISLFHFKTKSLICPIVLERYCHGLSSTWNSLHYWSRLR